MAATLVDIQKALMMDDLEGAINAMFTLDGEQNNNRFQNQIIHQSGRYHANEKSNNIGTISQEQYNRTRNQLRYALQQILSDFPGYSPEINAQAQKAMMASGPATDSWSKQAGGQETIYRILMLTSNPARTGELQLEKEHSRISRQIQNAQNPARFPIKPKQAVTLPQFSEALLDEKPAIVHFSGHGEINNAGQEIQQVINRGQGIDEDSHSVDDSGIILNSPDGREPFFVGTSVIKRIFQTIIQDEGIPIQAVIFNSCYSEAQAKALAELVPHVIGTSWKIKDDAAIAFADGFYSFFIRRENFQSAWNNGVNQAMAYNEPADRFIYYKDGKRVM